MTPCIKPGELAGKIIDVHSHVGVSLKAYALMEYPYAQTLEGLACQQRGAGVDLSVVFPFSPDLYFDFGKLLQGDMAPAARPVSPAPYAAENRSILHDLCVRCPELAGRFLPFVSADPGREIDAQVRELERLCREFPVYGMKINAVLCQSRSSDLLRRGAPILDFAQEHELPMLFHVTILPDCQYSQAADVFRIAESRPKLRFCMAHSLMFHRGWLERAREMPNVWVDTAALKIQAELIAGEIGRGVRACDLIDTDLSDHLKVMRDLAEMLPDKLIWGSDSPCYTYMCRRKQGDDAYREFALKATYADEVAALDALPPALRTRVAGENTLAFIFGMRSRT